MKRAAKQTWGAMRRRAKEHYLNICSSNSLCCRQPLHQQENLGCELGATRMKLVGEGAQDESDFSSKRNIRCVACAFVRCKLLPLRKNG